MCSLASVALPSLIKGQGDEKSYDLQSLGEVTKVATKSLINVIDENYYPDEEAQRSNMKHSPIGFGVQGSVDPFLMPQFPFKSVSAKTFVEDGFEAIDFAACDAPCNGTLASLSTGQLHEAGLRAQLEAEQAQGSVRRLLSVSFDAVVYFGASGEILKPTPRRCHFTPAH